VKTTREVEMTKAPEPIFRFGEGFEEFYNKDKEI